MAIFAISDLHLSLSKPKPMDIFGPAWADHANTIRRNWIASVKDKDIVLIPGDISWAMKLHEAMPDLNFLADLPGTKVLIRGNHDYWWQRRATNRIQREVNRNLIFIQGTSIVLDNIGITGTRGWRVDWESRTFERENKEKDFVENSRAATADDKSETSSSANHQQTVTHHPSAGGRVPITEQQSERILRRELNYLEQGLLSIPDTVSLKIAMLHFPPFDEHLRPNEFAEMLSRHHVDILVYGHVHIGLGGWIEGEVAGVRYHIVSADILNFVPKLIVP